MRYLLILLAFLLVAPMTAQEGYPLPDNLPPITAANAAQVTQLAQVGSKQQPGRLAWSSDSSILAVGTSSQIRLYTADAFDQPLHIIETDGINFVLEGNILNSNSGRWDVESGELVSQTTASLRQFISPDGTVRATFTIENDEVVVSLWDTTGSQLATLPTSVNQGVEAILISADNRRVILLFEGLYDENDEYVMTSVAPILQIWDVQQQDVLMTRGYSNQYVDRVELTADGGALLVVTRSNDEGLHVELWNPQSGEAIGTWDYVSLQPRFSPDKRMVAFSGNRDIQLWNGHELVPLHYEYGYDNAGLRDAIFSPDGKTIAVITEYAGMVLLWDISAGTLSREPDTVLQGEAEFIGMVFSPDSSLLAVNAANNEVQLWDLTAKEVRATLTGISVRFSPDGVLFMTASRDSQIHVWDTISGQKQFTFPRSVAVNEDWTHIAYWEGGTVKTVEVATGKRDEIPVIPTYKGYVNVFVPSSQQVIFTANNRLEGYDLRTGAISYTIPQARWTAAISQDGRWLVVDENLAGIMLNNRKPLSIWDTTSPDTPTTSIEVYDGAAGFLFSPDGTLLARKLENMGPGPGSQEQLWDTRTGQLLATWTTGSYALNPHAFSADGTLLATGVNDALVALWDVEATLKAVPSIVNNETQSVAHGILEFFATYDKVKHIAFSPKGDILVVEISAYAVESGFSTYRLYLWPVANPLETDKLTNAVEAGAVMIENVNLRAFSPDSRLVVTQDMSAPILRLWDVETGKQYAELPDNRLAAFSPDGALLATYGEAGLALWEVAALVQGKVSPLVVLPDDIVNVSELAFNPDGTLLFVRGVSSVGVWGIAE
jgi:WD40 repeat protein